MLQLTWEGRMCPRSDERTRPTWRPIFAGAEADPYARCISEIVDALSEQSVVATDWGRPLLHVYLAMTGSALGDVSYARDLIEQAGAALANPAIPVGLYGGVAGVGWLAAHIQHLLDERDDSTFETVDDALLSVASGPFNPPDYDLIGGLVGLGVYFLERLPNRTARRGLDSIIEVLSAAAERHDDEATWRTPSHLLPDWQRAIAPDGYYNLGVAHGVPGVVGLLAEMGHRGVCGTTGHSLLVECVRWVKSHCRPDFGLPSWVGVGSDPRPARIAWCYGPLGVAVVLLSAAIYLDDGDTAGLALEMASAAATRRGTGSGVNDAGLCHGAAGNGHLFNRLYQTTDREEFREAAVYWFGQAIGLRCKDGRGMAGYLAWEPARSKPSTSSWRARSEFLPGVTGIALAYLGATSSVEPLWDRSLLCSIRPGSHRFGCGSLPGRR
jgi:lantibiotic biosynthesis protein